MEIGGVRGWESKKKKEQEQVCLQQRCHWHHCGLSMADNVIHDRIQLEPNTSCDPSRVKPFRTWLVCLFRAPFLLPLFLTVFKNPVCKVYRFQTVDNKWMLVREQMEECTLSFSIPKQLLSLYIQEDMSRWVALKSRFWSSPCHCRLSRCIRKAPLPNSAGTTFRQRYLRKKKLCSFDSGLPLQRSNVNDFYQKLSR